MIDAKILATGRNNDPRTFVLFLSTRRTDVLLALELARDELANRQDIFTRDALAWALLQNGDLQGARENIALALAEGTQDARLFYHAAEIAAAAHDNLTALSFSKKAEAIRQMLFPVGARRPRSAARGADWKRLNNFIAVVPRNTTTKREQGKNEG